MADTETLQSLTTTYADLLQYPVEQKDLFFLVSREGGEQNILMRLYDSMRKHPSFQGYSIYFSIFKMNKEIRGWCRQRKVKRVSWEGEAYLRLLATSACIISDVKLPIYFCRRKGQMYWNLANIQDRETRQQKCRTEYEQKVALWRLSQDLLQSSHILATDARDVQLLRDEYLLENVYEGLVYRIDGIHQQEGQVGQLRDLLMQEDPKGVRTEVLRSTEKKHKVLIQMDWNQKDQLREWVSVWLRYVDHDRYDVTLVTGRARDTVDLYKLSRLPEKIRVMVRRGYTLCQEQQKERLREYDRDFWLMSEEERRDGHLDMQEIYENEWRKIFGCACFDTIVSTSMHPLWYLGTQKHCVRRVFIATREINSRSGATGEDLCRWENKWAAMRKMDAVFWFGTETLTFDWDLDGLRKLPTPVPVGWLENDTGHLTTLQYQERGYALLLQGKDWKELRGQVEFIPIPPLDQKAYVACGPLSKVLPGFRLIREREPDSFLYIFVEDLPDRTDILEEELKGYVMPIGGGGCGDIPGAFEYFQRFQGGLVHHTEVSGRLASMMGLLGRPVYKVDDDHIEEISIQIDRDRLYTQGKEAVEHIWES